MWARFATSLLPPFTLRPVFAPMATLQQPLEPTLDILTATAGGLRQLLDCGKYTSVELVQLYLTQIDKHNHAGMKLHAITTIAPVHLLLEEARTLDLERQKFEPGRHSMESPLLWRFDNYSLATWESAELTLTYRERTFFWLHLLAWERLVDRLRWRAAMLPKTRRLRPRSETLVAS